MAFRWILVIDLFLVLGILIVMSLSSLQLDAFASVASQGSFSKAAKALHITQSALSQRVAGLESELEITLFIRDHLGVRLTEAGERLLNYVRAKGALEKECLFDLHHTESEELSGNLRVGGFSTYNRSKLLPLLGRLTQVHRHVHVEMYVHEIRDLFNQLRNGSVDFIFTLERMEKQDYVCRQIDVEENVLIESSTVDSKAGVYIDHDEFDTTTAKFWQIQKRRPKSYKRQYFDEIYTIIDAVRYGLGRAVVPRHLVSDGVSVISGYKPLLLPVYLMYPKRDYLPKLHLAFLTNFAEN